MPDIAAGRSNSAGKIGGRADYFRICRLQPAAEEWPACMVRLEKEKAGFGYTHFKTKTRGLLTREEIWERRICRPLPTPRQIADGESAIPEGNWKMENPRLSPHGIPLNHRRVEQTKEFGRR